MRINGVTWVIVSDGRVLLERCPKKADVLGYPDAWFVPGGKLEHDETEAEALMREIHEEMPWVRVEEFVPLPIIEGSPVPATKLRDVFLMRPFAVKISGSMPNKNADGVPLRYFPVELALSSRVPQVRMMVAAAVERFPDRAADNLAGVRALASAIRKVLPPHEVEHLKELCDVDRPLREFLAALGGVGEYSA